MPSMLPAKVKFKSDAEFHAWVDEQPEPWQSLLRAAYERGEETGVCTERSAQIVKQEEAIAAPSKKRRPRADGRARFRHRYGVIVRTEYDQPTTHEQLHSLLSNWDGAGDIKWDVVLESSVLSAEA